jgi:polysaccharide transporter, PST family
LSLLTRSVFRLQLLQLLAIGLPILTQIWLARTLGAFEYGRFVFVAALTAYFVLLCDFGFAWSASRAIAIHRDDAQRRAEIVCTTMLAKGVLFLLCVLVLIAMIVFVEQFRLEASLLVVALGSVFGSAVSPAWYFIGSERAVLGYALDIIGKSIAAAIAVIWVRDGGDVLIAVAAVSAGAVLSGLLGLAIVLRERDQHWAMPSKSRVLVALRSGVPLFLSTSAVSLYTAMNGLVLGFVSDRAEVAYFGAAQRVVGAASLVFSPFHQVFYPKIAHELHHQPRSAARIVLAALFSQGSVGLVAALAIYMLAEPLAVLLFGESFPNVVASLKLMAAIPAIIGVASVFSNFVMMALGRDRLHLVMTCVAAIANLLVLAAFGGAAGAIGASAALLVAETVVLAFALVAGIGLLKKAARGAT